MSAPVDRAGGRSGCRWRDRARVAFERERSSPSSAGRATGLRTPFSLAAPLGPCARCGRRPREPRPAELWQGERHRHPADLTTVTRRPLTRGGARPVHRVGRGGRRAALPGAGGGAARGGRRAPTSSSTRRPGRARAWSPSAPTCSPSPRGSGRSTPRPIKALVSEKFFALCRQLGSDHVGMLTGDASVNPDAPVICCTAEILANMALRDGADADGRPGRDGRVPLLRRPRPGLGLAGAAARAAAGSSSSSCRRRSATSAASRPT